LLFIIVTCGTICNMKTGSISKAATLGLILGMAACGGCDDKPAAETTKPVTDTISLKNNSEVYAAWDELYSAEDPSFSIDSFVKNDTVSNELFTTDFTPSDSFFKRFGKLLVYNNDSSVFIDAYSTTWMIEPGKDGILYAREGEVDQEVAIVNTKTNKRIRLLFCGPSCQFQKVFWYNDEIVGVMGMMAEYADEYYTPTIWFVNINTGVTIPYHYHSAVSLVTARDYMKRHMESRGITMKY